MNTDPVQTPVQDAEIINEQSTNQPTVPTNTPPPAQSFDINAYNATLEVVRRRIGILEKSKDEIKKLKEMYNDIFINDNNFNEADKVVKDTMKKRKDVQSQLAKKPAAVDLNGKIKGLKEQIKDNETSLSDELMEYYKVSGVTEIEDENGTVHEFAINIKLKPKYSSE